MHKFICQNNRKGARSICVVPLISRIGNLINDAKFQITKRNENRQYSFSCFTPNIKMELKFSFDRILVPCKASKTKRINLAKSPFYVFLRRFYGCLEGFQKTMVLHVKGYGTWRGPCGFLMLGSLKRSLVHIIYNTETTISLKQHIPLKWGWQGALVTRS